MEGNPSPTIQEVVDDYLAIKEQRNQNSGRTYGVALRKFCGVIEMNGLDPKKASIADLHEGTVSWLIDATSELAPATERLYLDALADFFRYVESEELRPVNMAKVRWTIRMRARRPGRHLPQFPKEDIDRLLEAVAHLGDEPYEDPAEHLRALRDRALIITLADTGLRIHEACKLNRGSIDFNTRRAIIRGKGDKDAVIRFSSRSIQVIQKYLSARTKTIDGSSGKPLSSLPVFARHDRGAGKKVKRMTTRTGQNILEERVGQLLGPQAVKTITPHSLRHYFVTEILLKSDNLKLAQKLARHENIAITQRYAHLSDRELDNGYADIFNGE